MRPEVRLRCVRLALVAAALLSGGAACSSPTTVRTSEPPTSVPDDDVPVDMDASASRDGAKTDGDAGVITVGEPVVTLGAKDRTLLIGTIVTPEDLLEGQVLVEGNLITCVASGAACAARPGAQGATVVDTKAIIAPGMVDTHNHILFDVFDETDWTAPKVYANHEEWTTEPRYQALLDVKQCLANDSQGKPGWCAQTPYGTAGGSLRCEMNKWGELKGLIAGTTSIVGLPGTSAGCFASIARSVDVPQSGLTTDKVQTSALFPPSNPSAVCTNVSTGKTDAYLVHCGEGVDAKSRDEFALLGTSTTPDGCLYEAATAITHGTAFTSTEFASMAAAGMKLIWSPRSNVSLYATTTDIPAALTAGVTVAIAPDWSISGSVNLLAELRFAKQWDAQHWGDRLTARDLVVMATLNGAKALALEGTIGVLQEGALADIAVFTGNLATPYESVLAATPRAVRMVMVGGNVVYGDKSLEAIASSDAPCETIDVCQNQKFLCAATSATQNKLDQTYATIKSSLEQAMTMVDGLTPDDGFSFAPLAPLVTCP